MSEHDDDEDDDTYEETPILSYQPDYIWVGASPVGHAHKGNSILLKVRDRYVFIGNSVFQFCASAPITRFVSPVGNSDVPYPYAIDSNKNYYLLIEKVMLRDVPHDIDDPYDYYYRASLMTPDLARPLRGEYPTNIREFTIGKEKYTMTYHPRPSREYDRIASWPDFGKGMAIRYADGRRVALSRERYSKLLQAHGRRNGFSAMRCIRVLVQDGYS